METSKKFGIFDFKNVLKSTLVVFGILAISAIGFSAGPLVASATESQVDTEKIYAKSLLGYECDANEWHFIITGIKDGVEAPSYVSVEWSDTSLDVDLEKVTGKSAHYRTSENLNASLVSANTYIDAGWEGQFNVSHGPCVVEEEEEEEEEEPLGLISVCKAIVDDEGNVVDGSEVSGSFELSGLDFNSPAGVLPASLFAAPLSFNMDLFPEVDGDDAQCVTYEDLVLGSYYYGEESIVGDDWVSPMYNDQHNNTVKGLSDFFPYSSELFTEDTGDDSNRNTNADGQIVLTKERPNRTLVVLNAYEIKPAPYCGDGIINQAWEQCDGGDQCTLECTVIDIPDNSCPFEPADGRIIIDFEDGGKVMDVDGYHYSGPVDALVPAGTYIVSLASFDGYDGRSIVNQPEEIWKLRLKDGNTFIVDSNPSTDLPDDVDYVAQSEIVNQALVVPTDTNLAKAWHAAEDGAPTVNSVEPVCAALDVVLPNQKPVITLRGDNPVMLYVGESYVEAEADVDDAEDGDIDNKLVIDGAVNTNVADTYIVTYNATDTENLAADEVTRQVIVRNIPEDPKQCEDGLDNDGDELTDIADPGCHSDGNPDNPDSYEPKDDDETHEIAYAPYCGDGLANQEWESCDGGEQCTDQCQLDNQCVEKAFARVNTNSLENHGNGDVTSDVFLGSTSNKIPASAWFILYNDGAFVTDPSIGGYENVPGLAVERQLGAVKTVLFGSHPHDGSKEHINGDVEFFNIEVVSQSDDTSGNNKLENGFDNVMDDVPGQDEVWLIDGNDSQSFFWLTVTTADDGFFSNYGDDVPMCELPENKQPVIILSGPNPLIISLFGTYLNPGATASDFEDGNISDDIVVGGDIVNTNAVGNYFVTYDVVDSEGLAAETATRTVSVIDDREPAECSDNSDNDSDSTFDETDPGCWTDPNDPETYDPNDDSENEKPVITLSGDNPLIIQLFGIYTNPGATAEDPEDGDVTGDVVSDDSTVNTNEVGNYIVTYNVSDSEGLAADEVTRIVSVRRGGGGDDPECSDNDDNDSDSTFDETDPGCWTDPTDPETYDPNDDSENEIPVITLRGNSVIDVMLGTSYTEALADVDDAEDGDIDGNLVIGGDVVDTNATGTYTVTYNAQDSLGAPAVEVTRTVNVLEDVTTECSDQIDNDEDGATDADDAGCWTDPSDPESYDPNDNDENNKPVITRVGDNVRIVIGTLYNDEGATANDDEDGNITSDIVTTGTSTVNVNSAGFYTISYNVVDSDGLAALEVTRTVEVYNPSSNPVCTSNCGGGGGGGHIPNNLRIFNEMITVIGEGTALITWETNKPADSRVVYDDDSQSVDISTLTFGLGADDLGYEFTTDTAPALTLEHSMLVTNVNLEDLFYFRPLSSDGTRAIGIELSAVLGQVTGGTCEQLLFEFIRFGSSNNPSEVIKLQTFLNEYEGNNLVVNGIYDRATFDAVVVFQNKYAGDVLSPWGLQSDTGYVYLTTRKKINEIYCNFRLPFPLTSEQQEEVNAFKALLAQLEATGQPLPDTSNVGLVPSAPSFAEGGTPNTSLTEETTSEGGLATDEDGNDEGEDDSLAAAISAVEGKGQGFFSRIGNLIKGIFR